MLPAGIAGAYMRPMSGLYDTDILVWSEQQGRCCAASRAGSG